MYDRVALVDSFDVMPAMSMIAQSVVTGRPASADAFSKSGTICASFA